jgi:hypothetical protein
MVVKDVGMKDYFSGASPIVSGELGEDFTYYYATSALLLVLHQVYLAHLMENEFVDGLHKHAPRL